MKSSSEEYEISIYLTEFKNRRTEDAYQRHIQNILPESCIAIVKKMNKPSGKPVV